MEDLWYELMALTDKIRTVNESTERSRELSLAITALENAEDKIKRHLAGSSFYPTR